MTMPEDIASYLQTKAVGTVGTDLFRNQIPSSPDNCIAVFQYAGQPPIQTLTQNFVDRPGLQVRVRNLDSMVGLGKAENIVAILEEVVNQTIGTAYYVSIQSLQAPIPLGLDNNNRFEWTVNFKVSKRR